MLRQGAWFPLWFSVKCHLSSSPLLTLHSLSSCTNSKGAHERPLKVLLDLNGISGAAHAAAWKALAGLQGRKCTFELNKVHLYERIRAGWPQRAISAKSLSIALSQNIQVRKLSSPQEIKHPRQAKINCCKPRRQQVKNVSRAAAPPCEGKTPSEVSGALQGNSRQKHDCEDGCGWATFLQQVWHQCFHKKDGFL